jgi:hypothetical protein
MPSPEPAAAPPQPELDAVYNVSVPDALFNATAVPLEATGSVGTMDQAVTASAGDGEPEPKPVAVADPAPAGEPS